MPHPGEVSRLSKLANINFVNTAAQSLGGTFTHTWEG